MKIRWNRLTIEHYIRYMRRQPKHMQHVHALVFAGVITALIGIVILYTDYGFWHETYIAESSQEASAVESPGQAIKSFFIEAKDRFSEIGTSAPRLLESRETYTKDASGTE